MGPVASQEVEGREEKMGERRGDMPRRGRWDAELHVVPCHEGDPGGGGEEGGEGQLRGGEKIWEGGGGFWQG